MIFATLPEASHQLVSLRPIEGSDLQDWYDYLSLPVVHEHTSWKLQSPGDLAGHVWGPDSRAPAGSLRLAIALRTTGQLVGTAGFQTVLPQNRSAELAYDLSPRWWGRGIATSIATLLVEWGHAQAGLIRVQAVLLDSNERSAKVLHRCGFQREGLLRGYRMVRGHAADFWMYAHLPESYP